MMDLDYYDIIYIDLDGTLLEDKYRHYNCYVDIVEKYGGSPVDIDEYWNGKRNKEKRTTLLEKTEFGGTYEQYFQEWVDRIEKKEYLFYEFPKPRALEILCFLNRYTDKLVLVTMRKSKEMLLWQLERMEMTDCFDDIKVGTPLLGQTKADLIKKNLNENCLVIGDTEDDMGLANKIGCRFLAVTNGLRDKQYLQADFYVNELKEILL